MIASLIIALSSALLSLSMMPSLRGRRRIPRRNARAAARRVARNASNVRYLAMVTVKFFIAKISCTYTTNYLRQEKSFAIMAACGGGYIRINAF
jgi:NO-binding membrane sensor protein with MHYT domain